MPLLRRKMAITAKIETTVGTDSVPTLAADAMLVRNVDWTPLEMELASRDLARPYLGNLQSVVVGESGRFSYEVEVAGSGTAGTAPKYGPLLRACALAQAITAGVRVSYTPVSAGFEAVSQYFYLDGILHRFLSTRGTVDFDFTAKAIPVMKFSFVGTFQPVADSTLTAVTYTQQDPVAVNRANTALSFFATPVVAQSVMVGLRNDIKYRNLMNYEGVDMMDRAPGGSISFEQTLVATRNWVELSRASTSGALVLTHGTVAGNIVRVTANQTIIRNPKYGELDGSAMVNADLELNPTTAGNNEILIEVL
jgi:hypothetical protein